jgi:hypothetical protein
MNLDAVHDEDKVIVRNVISAIQSLKKDRFWSSWTVVVASGCYVVNAFPMENVDFELGSREIDMLHDISPLRVIAVSIGRQGGKVLLRVRVSDKDTPLMLTETQVFHVRKRTRWMIGGGGSSS